MGNERATDNLTWVHRDYTGANKKKKNEKDVEENNRNQYL